MFTTMMIGSCEYYLRADERGDRTSYYTDADPTGLDGETQTWFVPEPRTPIVNGMAAFATDGAAVNGDDLRSLAAGRHPLTQAVLTQRRDIAGRKPRAGQDCTMSAPKSVSTLYAANPELREGIRAAQEAAVRRALTFMAEQGLVRTRTGKGSKKSEAAGHWAAAIFHHSTSRPQDGNVGDPQIHSHCVLPAVVQRAGADGSTGALDNTAILTHATVIGAVYRAELAAQLRARCGIECERDDRVFKVAGCPTEAADVFSKRREAVVKAMGGRATKGNAAAAQRATINSRSSKVRVTAAELQESWTAQLAAIGHDSQTIAEAVRLGGEAVAAKRSQAIADMREADGADELTDDELNELALSALAAAALKDCFTHDAVCPKRKLLLAVEKFQGLADATTALRHIDAATAGLVEIGVDKDGDRVWTTPELIAAERSLLLNSVGRLDEREWIPAAAVEAAIAAKRGISPEQSDAVRRLCNRDGVSVLVGSAGSGKSWSSQCVVEAARLAGEYGGTSLKCFAIAPSWAASDVVRSDTEVAEAMSAAVAAFIARVQSGKIRLDADTLIVVDESGMIGTEQMAQLLEIAKLSKVVLMGDPLQLQPVSAGAPLKLIAAKCGDAEIRTIMRQQSEKDGAWQRAASERFAKGDCAAVLEYDDRGCITWADGKDDAEAGDGAMQLLARDWAAHLAEHPDFDDRGRRTRLCLASKNADVHRLNALLRAEFRAAGRLADDEFVVKSVRRGQNSAPQELSISVGDSLIWGERIELRGQPIVNNSDGCVVLAIDGDPADPTVRVRLDKGGEVTAKWSQYVGKPKPDQPAGPRSPKCQHYYCATVHQSQGRTVRDAFVLNAASARGLGSESTYVGMTRHTTSCRMYVDTSALIDRVPDGDPSLTDEQEAARVRAELRNILVADSNRSESKDNVSDFAADTSLQSFIASGDLTMEPSPAELIRRRLNAVSATAARKESAMLPPRPALRTAAQSQAEIDHWRRMNLADFIIKENPTWKGKEWRSGTFEIRTGGKNDDKYGVKQFTDGKWGWTCPNPNNGKGDIFGWLSHHHHYSFKESCAYLRENGYGLNFDDAVPHEPPPPPPPRPDGPLSVDELSEKERQNLNGIGAKWAATKRGWTDRLTAIRRLSEATLSYFSDSIRAIGNADCFAHRLSDGTVSGWEEKYAKGTYPDRTGGFSSGGRRALFRGGNTANPSRICIFEAAIDAMSYHDLRPDQNTLYVSLGGNVVEAGRREIAALAKRHKGAEFSLCVDNDDAGEIYRTQLTNIILEADPAAVIVADQPTIGKDWNDELVAVRNKEDGIETPTPTAAPIVPTTAPPTTAAQILTTAAPTPPPSTAAPLTKEDVSEWLENLTAKPTMPAPTTTAAPIIRTTTAPIAPTTAKPDDDLSWLDAPAPPSKAAPTTAPIAPPPTTAKPAQYDDSWLDDFAATTQPPTPTMAPSVEDAEDARMAAKLATAQTTTAAPAEEWTP